MDELCQQLSKTHLFNGLNPMDEITAMMYEMNIKDYDLDGLENMFDNIEIKDDIINCANEANNINHFYELLKNMVKQRGSKRCYQLNVYIRPFIY